VTAGLEEDHRDALQELCNVAMGSAGESLAAFTGAFVELSIPRIRFIEPRELTVSLTQLGAEEPTTALAQPFLFNDCECFALVVITENSVAELCNQKLVETEAQCDQLLLDFCGSITEVCLDRLAELTDFNLDKSPVYSVAREVPVEELVFNEILHWHHLWAVEINYHLEGHPFNCDLVLMLPDLLQESLIAELERLLIE